MDTHDGHLRGLLHAEREDASVRITVALPYGNSRSVLLTPDETREFAAHLEALADDG